MKMKDENEKKDRLFFQILSVLILAIVHFSTLQIVSKK